MHMIPREPIAVKNFLVSAHAQWYNHWMLLTAGDFQTGHFNTMTVGWGSFGTMWNLAFALVAVRPSRYTFEFIERYPTFTLCGFPHTYRKALQLLGSVSGRDRNKIAEAGLTPEASSQIAAPGFAEANLLIECRKVYWDDLKPTQFLAPDIEKHYPLKDYHRIYFGEILAIAGTQDNATAGGLPND